MGQAHAKSAVQIIDKRKKEAQRRGTSANAREGSGPGPQQRYIMMPERRQDLHQSFEEFANLLEMCVLRLSAGFLSELFLPNQGRRGT